MRRLVRMHLLLAAALLLYTFVIGRCPILWLTGVPCPGCGMTRALTHAVRLDFAGAFYYHPLWFAVPPAVLYLAHLAVYLYRLFWQPDPAIRVDFGASAVARLFARLTA